MKQKTIRKRRKVTVGLTLATPEYVLGLHGRVVCDLLSGEGAGYVSKAL